MKIQFKTYASLVKFSHTLFAMPFALTGYFIAAEMDGYGFSLKLFLLVILCMIFARNAAMGFNRYADRHIDALNQRTNQREIPAGKISSASAFWFVIMNCILFIFTTHFINSLCFYLSPVALVIILVYSLTKKFTWLCHFVLGLGLALAPIGAYIAVSGKFALLPLMISILVITWVSGFDIIYAIQDEAFDRQEKLHSLPVVAGIKGALLWSAGIHIISLAMIIIVGILGTFNWLYWAGAILFGGLLIYQHYIVKPNDLSNVNLAFFTLNGVASVIYAVFSIGSMYFFR